MPKDKKQIQSLSDLLQLYSYLNKTYGVSSGVRVDLIVTAHNTFKLFGFPIF
jgi:hypothetical protein